jgi:hypothetical protein
MRGNSVTAVCRTATAALNDILGDEAGAAHFRELMNQGASPREFVRAIADRCEPSTRALIHAEFDELPRSFMSTWLIAWRLADEAGQTFEMISEPAQRPLEYAKAGRVAYRIEHDVEGVRMYVSHVHGHHADWFKPVAEAVATV